MANPITGMFIRPLKQRQNARKLNITAPQGIGEERYVSIGGIEQWVTIRGQNRANPVIVIVHGGPASPYTPFNSWITAWEEHFTIVQYDQRGAGRTFSRNAQSATGPLSLQRLADDGIELVEYALKQLGKDKVILLGSSVGSLIGLLMIHSRPELFAAYVGADQNSPGGALQSYQLTLQAAKEAGDKKAIATLQTMGNDPSTWTYAQYLKKDKLAIRLTPDVPNMVNDLMLPALLFAPNFTMKDIKAVQQGMESSGNTLFREMVDFDFAALGYDFAVPFFVLQGEHDIITPVESARAYVDKVHAPRKAFVTIPHAAHLAEFANPHTFLRELREYVLLSIKH